MLVDSTWQVLYPQNRSDLFKNYVHYLIDLCTSSFNVASLVKLTLSGRLAGFSVTELLTYQSYHLVFGISTFLILLTCYYDFGAVNLVITTHFSFFALSFFFKYHVSSVYLIKPDSWSMKHSVSLNYLYHCLLFNLLMYTYSHLLMLQLFNLLHKKKTYFSLHIWIVYIHALFVQLLRAYC